MKQKPQWSVKNRVSILMASKIRSGISGMTQRWSSVRTSAWPGERSDSGDWPRRGAAAARRQTAAMPEQSALRIEAVTPSSDSSRILALRVRDERLRQGVYQIGELHARSWIDT